MITTSKAKIFLADERGCTEQDGYRTFNTFNFGAYNHPHKTPFGGLCVLNDDTLAGGKSITITVDAPATVVLLPIVGAIKCGTQLTEAGQCRILTTAEAIRLTNPYEHELVNFLQLWISHTDAPQSLVTFDIDDGKDRLIELNDGLFIGKFQGRSELNYTLRETGNGIFVFVIEGAFEVQYRLLHARDGLALWDVDAIELEALSNDAIILIAEVPL